MNLRTEIQLDPIYPKINYASELFFIGSCFSDVIGNRFKKLQFRSTVNPFGVVFNPISISRGLNRIVTGIPYKKEELIEYNNHWISLHHHSSISADSIEILLNNLNNSLMLAHEKIKKTEFLFITLGTSWVFEDNESGDVVANCHKLPANRFKRRILEVDEIVLHLKSAIKNLKSINSDLNCIVTVSPVRHTRNGLVDDQLSKAKLILASHGLVSELNEVNYFPAYEMMVDDLRDYRFYKDDLIHPSTMAENYIWSKLLEYMVDDITLVSMNRIDKILREMAHRPNNISGDQEKERKKNLIKKITLLEKELGLDLNTFRNSL